MDTYALSRQGQWWYVCYYGYQISINTIGVYIAKVEGGDEVDKR
jgi:hypothetical protein